MEAVKIPNEIMAFGQALDLILHRYMENPVIAPLTGEQVKNWANRQIPLLSVSGFNPDPAKLNESFKLVAKIVREQNPALAEQVSQIETVFETSKDELLHMLKKVVWQDKAPIEKMVLENNFNGDLAVYLLTTVAKPFVKGYAEVLKPYIQPGWRESICPVCGWKPLFAVKTGSHGRELHCSLCDTRWAFKNLACPHCLSEDHEDLKYYTVGNEEPYHLNVCEKCKGYIKTIDETKIVGREKAFLTDLKTLHLDLLAEAGGYKNSVEAPGGKSLN